MRELSVARERFTRISSAAFNVDNIDYIDIWGTNISVIEDNAFYSKKKSVWTFGYWTQWLDNDFILQLMDNHQLSGDSFAPKAFSNIHKPTKLYFGHDENVFDDDNSLTSITYLPEKTFLPFLQISDNNLVLLEGFPLDCNDCRNAWLKNNPNELKKVFTKIYIEINHYSLLRCPNNKKFDDEVNFNNCTTHLRTQP